MKVMKIKTKYIRLEDAIALAKDIVVPTKSGYNYRHRCIDPQDLAELPAADVVERKTGVWLMDKMTRTCSVCGQMKATHHKDNYCPNCGAKMETDPFDDNPPMEYFESGGI